MKRKLLATELNGLKLTVEITRMARCSIVVVAMANDLQVQNWRIGMQTPYEALPTVITVRNDGTQDDTYDTLVRTVSKKTGGDQVALSLNLPTQLTTQNNLILSKLIADEILSM